MDRWVGIVCLAPPPWSGACCEQSGGKFPPLGVRCLLLDDGREIKGVREDVGLSARVTDEALGIEFLCHLHRLLGTDPQLARNNFLHFLISSKNKL